MEIKTLKNKIDGLGRQASQSEHEKNIAEDRNEKLRNKVKIIYLDVEKNKNDFNIAIKRIKQLKEINVAVKNEIKKCMDEKKDMKAKVIKEVVVEEVAGKYSFLGDIAIILWLFFLFALGLYYVFT